MQIRYDSPLMVVRPQRANRDEVVITRQRVCKGSATRFSALAHHLLLTFKRGRIIFQRRRLGLCVCLVKPDRTVQAAFLPELRDNSLLSARRFRSLIEG